ncbi:hypothetical protein ASD11_00630 [Aeromicrobium sp. Root495]|uniref:TetR/AcrR family transcriptional regulator n=1 Tax=Aeromicrobium sp. Root495 TaxID=1736550 RepID=UPI0006F6B566|nr:TetR/AcrR family transcriptional regulator [Aeromicrobium sp. Root495]KQY58210.1 hypothetical protein ASD11_00630 [Aeromicrobium sp. Root495]
MATTRRYPHPRGDARAAIAAAARRLFAEKGYLGTSLKDLAAESDASITLIYRYFGSKAGLFDAALIEPGREFVDEFVRSWDAEDARGSHEALVGDLVRRLFAFVSDNRGLILAWSEATRSSSDDVIGGGQHGQGLRALSSALLGRGGEPTLDATAAETVVACTASLVVSAVLMEDVLFPPATALADVETRIAAITRFAQAGARAELERSSATHG